MGAQHNQFGSRLLCPAANLFIGLPLDNVEIKLVSLSYGDHHNAMTTALATGANLPDVDAACFFWLEGQEHLAFRRGITHGVPAQILLPLPEQSQPLVGGRGRLHRGHRLHLGGYRRPLGERGVTNRAG